MNKLLLLCTVISFLLNSCASKAPNISGLHIQQGIMGDVKNKSHFNIELLATLNADSVWANNTTTYNDNKSKSTYEFLTLPVVPILLFSNYEEKSSMFFGLLGLSPAIIYQNTSYNYAQPKIWLQFTGNLFFGGVGISTNLIDKLNLGAGTTFREAIAYGEGGFPFREVVGHELEFRIVTDASYDIQLDKNIIQFTSQIEFNKDWNKRVISAGINYIF